MVIPRRLTTLVTATSITLIQLLSSSDPSLDQIFRASSTDLGFSSAFASTPPARSKFRYVPPHRRSPKSTQITGSRGCNESGPAQPVSLTLLVPNDHDGLTTSGHPTFFWHVSAPVLMTFALTERGVVQPLIEQQIQPPAAGIIQVPMPKELPELVPDREYRWSVTLVCNPARPSADAFIHTWIKRVPVTPELTQQLTATTSEREHALTYAQAGLWYDALGAISTAYAANPNDQSILEDRLLLLDQAGLSQVVGQER